MHIIRPTTPKVDIVEVAKNAPMIQETPREEPSQNDGCRPQVETTSPGVFEGLGKDYGLIFRKEWNTIEATRDGKTSGTLMVGGYYHKLFLDGEHLYYTEDKKVISWPDHVEHEFDNDVWGMTKYLGDILCVTYDGRIVTLDGREKLVGCPSPAELGSLNGDLYHTEGEIGLAGLVKTGGRTLIYKTGAWAGSICELDGKLYFGGHDQKIYSYDGNRVEIEGDSPLLIWSICGVKESRGRILYVGGGDCNGIYRYDLEKRNGELILENSVLEAGSIVAAPLDLIDKFAREAKGARR